MKIIMMGEPMGLFIANEVGDLADVSSFSCSVAGAEFNVATGLVRLGHEAVYVTKLGADPLGKKIKAKIAEHGINSDMVLTDENEITGLMLKSKTDEGDPEIAYYRRGSAASKLSPQDIEELDLSGCEWLHVTGITPAISETAREAVMALIKRAKAQKMFISFDPNLRPQLWASEQIMRDTLNEIARNADLILPGIKEGSALTGAETPEEIASVYHKMDIKQVLIKLGGEGAFFSEAGGESSYLKAFSVRQIVDTVGAGDGFAAGVISALAEGKSLKEAAKRGLVIGAIQITHKSDNEGLPTKAELLEITERGYC